MSEYKYHCHYEIICHHVSTILQRKEPLAVFRSDMRINSGIIQVSIPEVNCSDSHHRKSKLKSMVIIPHSPLEDNYGVMRNSYYMFSMLAVYIDLLCV